MTFDWTQMGVIDFSVRLMHCIVYYRKGELILCLSSLYCISISYNLCYFCSTCSLLSIYTYITKHCVIAVLLAAPDTARYVN
jgi:hypothetical protein